MKTRAPKISIIGAGSVGSTLAMRVVENDLANVVLLDIVKEVACGKALDIQDSAPILGFRKSIVGTNDYEEVRSSDIVVITAGFPRRPGMVREELVSKNVQIVKEVSKNIKKYSPSSIVIVVTNPLDAMTYLAYKITTFPRRRVFGMAGVLDGSRFAQLLRGELTIKNPSVKTCILGSHGDTMVPILSKTRVGSKPIEKVLSKDRLKDLVERTKKRGAQLLSLLGTGSAYFSPSAATFKMIDAILNNTREILTASAFLEGEYGLKSICIGVPCKIGRNGIEDIVELDLSSEERKAFLKSAKRIQESISLL